MEIHFLLLIKNNLENFIKILDKLNQMCYNIDILTREVVYYDTDGEKKY